MPRTARKTASQTPSDKMTAAELRSWYEKNKKDFDGYINFKKATDAIIDLRDATKNSTKTLSIFNKEELREYLEDIANSESDLRNLSWYLYYVSHIYKRIINLYSRMFCLYARKVIPSQYSLVKDNNPDQILKSYQNTIQMLDKMDLQGSMTAPITNAFIQDVFYGIVFYDDTGLFIMPMPPDYCRISGRYLYLSGDFRYSINMRYFSGSREYLVEMLGEPIQSMYRAFQNDTTNGQWQPVPDEYCFCIKENLEDWEVIVPPFVGLFENLISLEDLSKITAVAEEQAIYKMLWVEMETHDNDKINDWKIDPKITTAYVDMLLNKKLIPDYTSVAQIPGKLNVVDFNNTDRVNDTSKITKATESVLNTAGGAELLNGATINTTIGYETAKIVNTEFAISSLLPQIQAWVNRFLTYHISKPCKVNFFPVSALTIKDFKKQLQEDAKYGMPVKLALNALNGYSEIDTMAMNYLEEEILQLHDKFRYPLSSSYTTPGDNSGDVGGRPSEEEVLESPTERTTVKEE